VVGHLNKYKFVANLPVRLSRKNFENLLIFGDVMGKSSVSCFFLTHGVYVNVTMTVLGQTVSAIFSLAKDDN